MKQLPSAQFDKDINVPDKNVGKIGGLIDRQAAIDTVAESLKGVFVESKDIAEKMIGKLPSAQSELIAQDAYVRGFEQGRTQGMIDVQGEPMNRLIDNTIKAEWTNADALDLQPTCNQLATDCISRQAAIDALDCINGVEEVLRALPSAQPEQRWILCSERLPEEYIGFYLVTVRKRRITALNVVGCDNRVHDIDIARWDYDRRAPQRGYHWCKADDVIAWMPLPELYKVERREDEDKKHYTG